MDAQLVSALESRDLTSAQRFIEDEDDPARVLAMYHGAIRHLYWSCKDVRSVTELGTSALTFGAELEDERALGLVKAIAYDIASFCWPGWDEPEIEIDDDILFVGSEAAGINLGLAELLDRPDAAKAAGHWIVGAHLLARGERSSAARIFDVAAQHAERAGERNVELLYRSYGAIVRNEPFDTTELATLDGGLELVAQLETAKRVFG